MNCPYCKREIPTGEIFPEQEINEALKAWLQYGERSLVREKLPGGLGHMGYFSGSGWAARVLRDHLQHRIAAEGQNE